MNLSYGSVPPQFNRENLVKPFIQIFDQAAYKYKSQFTINQSLDLLFPEQKIQDKQDKDIKKAREILGELAENMSDLQIKQVIIDIDFLIQSWLDNFERQLFKGKTLLEILHEKGGL